jgi:hypothetical protein
VLKHDNLTEQEYELLRKHPLEGEAIRMFKDSHKDDGHDKHIDEEDEDFTSLYHHGHGDQ